MSRLFSVKEKAVDASGVYTKKIQPPQYLPSNQKPRIEELCNTLTYGQFIGEINNSTISEEEKKFLRLAATRHIVFNYSKIADYYAHSNEEMQRLMEKSALVILDVDDAIANGYVRLSNAIDKIMRESGEDTGEK